MYVRICLYICVHISTRTHFCIYVCLLLPLYVCVRISVYMCSYLSAHIFLYICVYNSTIVYMCAYFCMHVFIFLESSNVCMCMCFCIHTCICLCMYMYIFLYTLQSICHISYFCALFVCVHILYVCAHMISCNHTCRAHRGHEVPTISGLHKNVGLFCRISPLL